MRFTPVRRGILAMCAAGIAVLSALGAVSAGRLFRPPMNWQSALALLGACLAVLGLPVLLRRLVLVLGVYYEIDARGLTARWGGAVEVLPLDEISELRTGRGIPEHVRALARRPFGSLARTPLGETGELSWFATTGDENLILAISSAGALALSPSDPVAFAEAFSRASEIGTVERVEPLSVRPRRVVAEILASRTARIVLAAGFLALLLLAMTLLALQPRLSPEQPFTFDALGQPSGLGSPGRLLLLPLSGAVVWSANLLLGGIAAKRRDWVAAHLLWGTGLIVALGLWTGMLLILRFA